MVGGLIGFIVGLSLGPLLAHVYLLAQMPAARAGFTWQSTYFTIGALGYALPAIAAARWARVAGSSVVSGAVVVLLSAIPLLVGGFVIWRNIQKEFGRKAQQGGNTEAQARTPAAE